jgi:hypothetical protein
MEIKVTGPAGPLCHEAHGGKEAESLDDESGKEGTREEMKKQGRKRSCMGGGEGGRLGEIPSLNLSQCGWRLIIHQQ